jgi:hypothetical protein
MSQSLWEPEEMEQMYEQHVNPEQHAEPEQPAESEPEAEAEQYAEPEQEQEQLQAQPEASEPQPEPADAQPIALSADEFSALEDRILRAVDLVKRERIARTAAEERALQAEAQLSGQTGSVETLQKEVDGLRAERDHVRQRVEKLLAELDALEL